MTRTDRDHLRTLAICHYVLGGFCFFVGSFSIIYIAIGIAVVTEAFGPPQQQPNAPPFPAEMGWFFIGIATLVLAFYWGLAAGLVVAGRCLGQRKWHTFCLIVAGAACLFQPLGLVLGIFTFIVLLRPGVRAAFEPLQQRPSEHDDYYTD